MKKLIEQILKFGVVGIICFFVDFAIYNVCNLVGMPYLVSGFLGFSVSVILNYVLSMKFVFTHNDAMSRKKEVTIFLILSVIGLGLNELLLYLFIDVMYPQIGFLQGLMNEAWWKVFAKLMATGIVMVYNFVTRKIFIEGRGK